jgi:bifunctional enzyme CysN/CysC
MATGASTADVAVILVDARKGLLTQTRRHTRIASLLGIRHVLLAVNKMDLVGYAQPVFEAIADAYLPFAMGCGITSVAPIPVSALEGDHVVASSARMPWYHGPTVLSYLETIDVSGPPSSSPFRMPVQWINRSGPDFRGVAGRVCAGSVRPGDRVRVLPSGVETSVKEIVTWGGNRGRADAGDAITLTLSDEVDISRGDVIAVATAAPAVADQFEATVLWMGSDDLVPGRSYLLKAYSKELRATVTAIKHRVDISSDAHLAAETLALNDIAVVNLSTSQPLVFEPYTVNRTLGAFILIDPLTFETVGAGLIAGALRRAANVHWRATEVTGAARAAVKHQRPACVWFTGLPSSGKSSIANRLEQRLHAAGRHTYLLDGDNLRHGLNGDLGFSDADRDENIRRAAEVARLMVDAGLIVMVAFISPFRAERRRARGLFPAGQFVEVFVDTPLEECERRDPKGLYAKARSGNLPNFTGIDSPYERPESPDVHVVTTGRSLDDCVEQVMAALAGQ